MSIIDKITGRAKKAAGDITGDPSLRSQGAARSARARRRRSSPRRRTGPTRRPRMWPTSSAAPEPTPANRQLRAGA